MSEVKNIGQEKLEQLNKLIELKNQLSERLIGFEMGAFEAKSNLVSISKALEEEQKELQEKYGDVEIDLATGEIKEKTEK